MAVLAFILTLFTNGAKVTYFALGTGNQIEFIFSGLLLIFGGNGKIEFLTTPPISFPDEILYFKYFFLKEASPSITGIMFFICFILLILVYVFAIVQELKIKPNQKRFYGILMISIILSILMFLIPSDFYRRNEETMHLSIGSNLKLSLETAWIVAFILIMVSSLTLVVTGLVTIFISKAKSKAIEKPAEEKIVEDEAIFSVSSGGEKELTISKFKNLLDRAEITEEEFDLIKDRLNDQ